MLDKIIEKCGGKEYKGDSFVKVKEEENGVTENE